MRERLLKLARELVEQRLQTAKLRTDDSIQAWHESDNRTLGVASVRSSTVGVTRRGPPLAAEIVPTANGIRVAPFLIRVRGLCDSGPGQPIAGVVDPDFPFIIPTVNGSDINATPVPILSTASEGVAWIRFHFTWNFWEDDSGSDGYPIRERPYAHIQGVSVVASDIGDNDFPALGQIPAYEEQEVVEDTELNVRIIRPAMPTDAFYYFPLGWWESNGGVVQSLFGAGPTSFGVTFPNEPNASTYELNFDTSVAALILLNTIGP